MPVNTNVFSKRHKGEAAARRPETSTALSDLHFQQQRFALLLAESLKVVAKDSEMSESEVNNLVYQIVQVGLLQQRRSPAARRDLAKTLGPSLTDLDPVPFATLEQARRLSALRTMLLASGALSMEALADARGITANNARQWVSRHRKADRIFTVSYEGESLIPAFLLNDVFDPRPEVQEPIRLLHGAGEDGWALWTWFATPSAWVGGYVPAELLVTNPSLVSAAARQRAATAA
jgi:hypothetical protein